MLSVPNKYLVLICIASITSSIYLFNNRKQVIQERDNYIENTKAAMSQIKSFKIDSSKSAVQIQTLNITLDEFKKLRSEDAEKIKKMGVEIGRLTMAAKHSLSVNVPIESNLKDTTITTDTIPITAKFVQMNNKFVQFNGVIQNDHLSGKLSLPVELQQVVWVKYKWKVWFLHGRVKNIQQTISSDNPYVQIKYSEFINIKN